MRDRRLLAAYRRQQWILRKVAAAAILTWFAGSRFFYCLDAHQTVEDGFLVPYLRQI